MWQQEITDSFRVQEPAETEESGHFLSFAKQSREVHRRPAVTVCLSAEDLPPSSSSSQYREDLWEKIVRHPSNKATCNDPCCGNLLHSFSREPAEMVWTGVKRVREEDLSVNTLPSPAQLMGRARKGGGRVQRGDVGQRQAAAVTQHIGDLRRKQGAIEQMKKEKWWGSTPGYTPENGVSFDVGNLTSTETLWSLDRSHTHPQYTAPSPTHPNSSTVSPQVFGGCTEEVMDLAPGRNPMMSFVVTGTAHREIERSWDTPCLNASCVAPPPLDTPYLDTLCLSHTEFWGFPSII